MKKYLILIPVLLLAASCSKQTVITNPNPPVETQPASSTPVQTPTSTPLLLPVKYDNTKYGFTFSLPADWQGFSTYTSTWTGTNISTGSQMATGTIVEIRNPKWTSQNPYEDIPVMVFTLAQWQDVQSQTMAVSAAPFGPSELGSNKTYVFALPPRYDYDFKTDYQEVEQIMQNNPLQGY
jgi:hypothetical protein